MTSPTPFRARAIAVATIAAAAMLLSGCSLLGGAGSNDAPRDAGGTPTAEKSDADVFSIKVGDCLDDATSTGTVTTAPIVPCTEPHDSEAYQAFTMTQTSFPGAAAVTSEADEDCASAFADFVGVSFDDSTLKISYYFPTKDSWNERADRQIMCTIYDDGVKTTGSLKGAQR